MTAVIIGVWAVVASIVGVNTVKDIKMEKAVAQFDKERVARNDDKELAEYLENLSQLRDGVSVSESLNAEAQN